MGKLECTRCGGVIEKPTFNEAKESLDHGVGLTRNRPCPNDGSNLMLWNGVPVDPKNPPTINTTPGGQTVPATIDTWPDNTSGSTFTVNHIETTQSNSTASRPPIKTKPKDTKTTKKTKK